MEAVAKLNNNPTSTRKMRLVIDLIRGKGVYEAMTIMQHTKKEPAEKIAKLIRSAISNWESKNEGLRSDEYQLFIKEIFCDGGKMIKRFRPAPFGRAHRIRKRSNHVTIVVDSKLPVADNFQSVTEDALIEEDITKEEE